MEGRRGGDAIFFVSEGLRKKGRGSAMFNVVLVGKVSYLSGAPRAARAGSVVRTAKGVRVGRRVSTGRLPCTCSRDKDKTRQMEEENEEEEEE